VANEGEIVDWVRQRLVKATGGLEATVAAFQARVAAGEIAWAIDTDGESAIASQVALETLQPLRDNANMDAATSAGLHRLFEDAKMAALVALLQCPWRQVSSSPVGLMKSIGTADGLASVHRVCEEVTNYLRVHQILESTL